MLMSRLAGFVDRIYSYDDDLISKIVNFFNGYTVDAVLVSHFTNEVMPQLGDPDFLRTENRETLAQAIRDLITILIIARNANAKMPMGRALFYIKRVPVSDSKLRKAQSLVFPSIVKNVFGETEPDAVARRRLELIVKVLKLKLAGDTHEY